MNFTKIVMMVLLTEIKVTTEILWKGAIFFALIDILFVYGLTKLIKPADLHKMKWWLVIFMSIFFCALFGVIISFIYWNSVYYYVFPSWSRWIIPPVYGLLFGSIGLLFWWLSFRLPANAVMIFCLLGGLWGIITHIYAIYRGILDKPPMLQGASPVAAVVIATFEFIFYWCVCLCLTFIIQRNMKPLRGWFKTFNFNLKTLYLVCVLTGTSFHSEAQALQGFNATGIFDEQELIIKDQWPNVQININAPLQLNRKGKTYLVFYALPNGNSIDWTQGKKLKEGEDWHFDIQHIAAQTRYIRSLDKKNNYIIAYLMADQKSWPTWKRTTPNSLSLIKNIIDSTANLFKAYHPKLVLNGHSGGGSLIFGFLDAVEEIPSNIERIAFLDSDYGYDEGLHKNKLVKWLNQNHANKLVVLAYNDSVVIYNGKQLVSPTGGTWYRSRLMQKNLSASYRFNTVSDTSFIHHKALNGRIKFIFKENPGKKIYHTVQVEKNGFILSILSATKFERKKYFTYFGERAYEKFIND